MHTHTHTHTHTHCSRTGNPYSTPTTGGGAGLDTLGSLVNVRSGSNLTGVESRVAGINFEDHPHTGTIFFPVPGGGGILHPLVGVALAPEAEDVIRSELACKTRFVQPLEIRNWLPKPQRFAVDLALERLDPSTTVSGLDYIDVPAGATRTYKMAVYAHKEDLIRGDVMFTNRATGEYLYYDLQMRSVAPDVLQVINLESPIRQTVGHVVKIKNPLPTEAAFSVSCRAPDVQVVDAFVIPPSSDYELGIEFTPLIVRDGRGTLTLTSAELGTFPYDVVTRALPVAVEQGLRFEVGLGSFEAQTFRFMSLARQPVTYSCSVGTGDFSVTKSIHVGAATDRSGVEAEVDVTFEPSQLGTLRDVLFISSPIGGDYECPLVGKCGPPTPQGPITVRANASTSIQFKNVLATAAAFEYTVDNPDLSVKSGDTLAAGKVTGVTITHRASSSGADDDNGGEGGSGGGAGSGSSNTTGRLIISTDGYPPWIYYIKISS